MTTHEERLKQRDMELAKEEALRRDFNDIKGKIIADVCYTPEGYLRIDFIDGFSLFLEGEGHYDKIDETIEIDIIRVV